MLQELQRCPLCHSGQFRLFMQCKDHSVSAESFAIQECLTCNLLFTNPRPEEKDLGRYYQSEKYISHSDEGNSFINRIYKLVRTYTLRQKLKLIDKWAPKGELLDVGCGTGYFLRTAQKGGWLTEGVEVNKTARTLAEKKLQQKLYAYLSDIPLTRRFHAITLWHVLEHVYDLGQTLSLLKELLHKQGSLVVAVPNPESYDAKHYGEYWAGWDVPRHLYHFSSASMHKLARKHGFSIKKTAPMYFDAFYVSMLSENYRQNATGILEAVKTGLKSNQWASKHNNQYSSIIYILQHS